MLSLFIPLIALVITSSIPFTPSEKVTPASYQFVSFSILFIASAIFCPIFSNLVSPIALLKNLIAVFNAPDIAFPRDSPSESFVSVPSENIELIAFASPSPNSPLASKAFSHLIPPKAFFIQSTIIVAFLSHSNSLANLNAVSNTPFIDFEIVFAIVKNSVRAKALFKSLAVSVPNLSNSK